MIEHAQLAPSASERWLTCPASVRMAQTVTAPPAESDYANEGSMAHKLAEIKAKSTFAIIPVSEYNIKLREWKADTPEEYQDEMIHHVANYVQYLVELKRKYSYSRILLEQQILTGVQGSWGTADAVIVSPDYVHVIDFKYGKGIPVIAEGNTQLMLYGIGALDDYGDILGNVDTVRMTIFQPRLDLISDYSLTAEEILAWRENFVKPIAEEALGEHARFNPTEVACRFCPAAGECKPRMMKFARMDFGDPDLLTPEELAEALERVTEIKDWCGAVESVALDKAYSQDISIPGWKVVRSGGKRSIPNGWAAVEYLVNECGYDEEQVARKTIKPIGELEKLMGKKVLPELLGDKIVKGTGRPSLVPESDSRPAINPITEAQKDFS